MNLYNKSMFHSAYTGNYDVVEEEEPVAETFGGYKMDVEEELNIYEDEDDAVDVFKKKKEKHLGGKLKKIKSKIKHKK